MLRILALQFIVLFLYGHLTLADTQSEPNGSAPDSYVLSVRDLVRFSVLNEEEVTTEQRIDGQGSIRVPYLGAMRIAGLTVRQAERGIERAYIDRDIYLTPQATLRVVEYAEREVSVLGEVNNPGQISFPIEANRLDIREVISQAGGFTNIARSRAVVVTRQESNRKVNFRVNVDEMLSNRRSDRVPEFLVEPGDVIYVPERFF